MTSNILLLGELYKERIKNCTGITVKFTINIVSNRCMARLADFKNSPKSRYENPLPDINRRCTRKIYDMGLCKGHFKKLNLGRIDEYPPEELINHYRKRDPYVRSKINIKYSNNYVKLKKRKMINIVIKINMSISKNNIKPDSIKKIVISNSNNSLENLYNKVIKEKKLNNKFVTIREKKQIIEDIKHYKTREMGVIDYIETINIPELVSISLRDNNLNSCILYKVEFRGECYLITNRKKIIGKLHYWIDEDDTVPKEYKTNDNRVLHPQTNLPILEIRLNHASDFYCGVLPGIYREYNYDEDIEAFMISNNILT